MDTGIPAPAGPHPTHEPAGPAVTALRDASARVAELAPDGGPTGPDDHAFDAAEHAARFEDLHDALSAVLDELDRS